LTGSLTIFLLADLRVARLLALGELAFALGGARLGGGALAGLAVQGLALLAAGQLAFT